MPCFRFRQPALVDLRFSWTWWMPQKERTTQKTKEQTVQHAQQTSKIKQDSVLIYLDLSWSVLICLDLSWSVLICLDLSWSVLVGPLLPFSSWWLFGAWPISEELSLGGSSRGLWQLRHGISPVSNCDSSVASDSIEQHRTASVCSVALWSGAQREIRCAAALPWAHSMHLREDPLANPSMTRNNVSENGMETAWCSRVSRFAPAGLFPALQTISLNADWQPARLVRQFARIFNSGPVSVPAGKHNASEWWKLDLQRHPRSTSLHSALFAWRDLSSVKPSALPWCLVLRSPSVGRRKPWMTQQSRQSRENQATDR